MLGSGLTLAAIAAAVVLGTGGGAALYTIHTVTNHLVRAGTLTEHICQAIVETAESKRDEDLETALIANPAASGGGAPEWRMRAALIVHYLERIESAMRQYLDRDLGEE